MTRKPLFLIIPVIVVIAALVLFFQRDNTGRSSNAPTGTAGLPTGSGANMPPSAGMDPGRSGTPQPVDRTSTPTSATPQAPSGEPAQRR